MARSQYQRRNRLTVRLAEGKEKKTEVRVRTEGFIMKRKYDDYLDDSDSDTDSTTSSSSFWSDEEYESSSDSSDCSC